MPEAPKSNGAIRSLAIVTPFYPPHLGGVERYAQEFARAASRLGLSVNVVTTDKVADPPRRSRLEGSGSSPTRPQHTRDGFAFPRCVLGLEAGRAAVELRRCHGTHPILYDDAVSCANYRSPWKRICVLDHGSGPLRRSPSRLRLASLAYEHLATAILKTASARFFGVSKASTDWLRSFGINDAQIVPNGVMPRLEIPSRKPDTFRDPTFFLRAVSYPRKGFAS